MCNKHAKGSKAKVEGLWNARVTLATMTMVKCWKKKCFGMQPCVWQSVAYVQALLLYHTACIHERARARAHTNAHRQEQQR